MWRLAKKAPLKFRTTSGRSLSMQIKDPKNLFSFTKGRWLYNNDQQLAARYVPFNISALADIAVEAAEARSCTSFEKLDEGLFNRAFLLRFDNDRELIARIPFPVAGPKHFMTASEVATMEYVRTELELPVPHVRAWSSRAESTPVGAEFIIYDKVPGVPLRSRWWDPEVKGIVAMDIITTIVVFERLMIDQRFSQIGSIYFKEDLPPFLQDRSLYSSDAASTPNSERFRIGPSLYREFWRGGRAALDIDRGPWPNIHSFARALSACERAWLKQRSDATSPEHLALLDDYDKLIPFLTPAVTPFTLWHPDMHEGNILATESDPCEITGVIDWQSSLVGPFFMQVTLSPVLHYSVSPYVDYTPGSSTNPTFAPGYEDLNPEQKKAADRALKAAFRARAYDLKMKELNPAMVDVVDRALVRELSIRPIRAVTRGISEGLPAIRDALIDVCDTWDIIVGSHSKGTSVVPCPIHFPDVERERHAAEYESLLKPWSLRESLHEQLGLDPDGFVRSEKYEAVKEAHDALREKLINEAEPEEKEWLVRCWPFQDGQLAYSSETCQ
ncbi:unnamed protein product [Cyclocybe aegerita]|uniref:Altered inheritance of mitochondria protein 9, mitochondrial n=1 Tax=Cyclocybe aegerita TaxID=1973307 RepID=A0A8S0WF71_CYCAE|nr:unnamed protein product [Cyclocybe aegerita]